MDNNGQDLYIWTHKKFEIGYNGKQVRDFSATGKEQIYKEKI